MKLFGGMMKLGERRDIKPLLVKFGVAFVFLAGVFVARVRRKGTKPSLPPPPKRFSDHGKEFELGGRTKHKDGIWPLTSVPASYEESYTKKVIVDNSAVGSGDNNAYLLPEFNELVKEVDFGGRTNTGCSTCKDEETPKSDVEPHRACRGSAKDDIEQEVKNLEVDFGGRTNTGFSTCKDVETPKAGVEPPRACRGSTKDDIEQEVKNLTNMVRMLQDREKKLEVQLLDYYGLKEQETAVMELQNRLKLNNMEGKLLNLKIESLQEDNRRLQAQAAEYAKTVSELENAKTKIKLLKKKLWNEAERNREQILAVQKRVNQLQEQANKGATSDPDTRSKLQRLKALEVEAEDLRKSNMTLQLENSELAQKLESIQMLTISAMEDPETEALKEISRQLKEQNESLSKEVEKLRADKCAGVEELVYLKWINACLRYELRNYQPPAGKTVARDLSKTLSPKSEEKTKQLILEYAHSEGHGNVTDIDSDRWSPSQASSITDSENNLADSAEKSFSPKSGTPKRNLFHRLRKLVLGKDVTPLKRSLSDDKMESFEDGGNSPWHSSPRSSSTHFLEIQRLRSINEDDTKNVNSSRSVSDLGSSYTSSKGGFILSRERDSDFEKQPDQDVDLLKFAGVFKSRHGGGGERTHRRLHSAGC